eukprot:GHVO01042289.1.p1 GENE.GHVO01042289.1~~GHVO01042289.1.p1  ORF type:complete len:130 (+),score=3.55 GHVO01042289.1:50-439(+)
MTILNATTQELCSPWDKDRTSKILMASSLSISSPICRASKCCSDFRFGCLVVGMIFCNNVVGSVVRIPKSPVFDVREYVFNFAHQRYHFVYCVGIFLLKIMDSRSYGIGKVDMRIHRYNVCFKEIVLPL